MTANQFVGGSISCLFTDAGIERAVSFPAASLAHRQQYRPFHNRLTMHQTHVQGVGWSEGELHAVHRCSFSSFPLSTYVSHSELNGKKWFSFFVIRNLFTPTRFLFRIITYLTRVHHAYNPTFIIKLISNLFHTFHSIYKYEKWEICILFEIL